MDANVQYIKYLTANSTLDKKGLEEITWIQKVRKIMQHHHWQGRNLGLKADEAGVSGPLIEASPKLGGSNFLYLYRKKTWFQTILRRFGDI